MDFEQRLEKAIHRGQQAASAEAESKRQRELDEEECRRLHAQYRAQITDQIQECLRRLPEHFPGFHFETIVDDRGWGAVITRDDVVFGGKAGPKNLFSRLEIVVRRLSSSRVLEVAAKGTIQNKEVVNRTQFQKLAEADPTTFCDMVAMWTLEFAEQYSKVQ